MTEKQKNSSLEDKREKPKDYSPQARKTSLVWPIWPIPKIAGEIPLKCVDPIVTHPLNF